MASNFQWSVVRAHGTLGTLGIVHVVPIRDLRAHPISLSCWCEPTVEYLGERLLVVHNSADGRELIERHGVN